MCVNSMFTLTIKYNGSPVDSWMEMTWQDLALEDVQEFCLFVCVCLFVYQKRKVMVQVQVVMNEIYSHFVAYIWQILLT